MDGQQLNYVQKDPNFTKWLILSIFQLFCCNQITGIIALVFAILANNDWKAGKFDESSRKYKNAKISIVVGFIIGALIYIAAFVLSIFAIMVDMGQY